MADTTGSAAGKGKGGGDSRGPLILLAVLVVLVIIVPAAAGYGLFRLLRRWFGTKENAALLGAGLIAALFTPSEVFGRYGQWLYAIVSGKFAFGGIPWLSLLVLAALFAAVYGLLSGSSRLGKFARVLSPRGTIVRRDKRGTDGPPLVPGPAERELHRKKSSIARTPGAPLLISADTHSVLHLAEPGKREFPIGLALDGRPVTLSESEIRTHGVILGATGSGKSETIKALAGSLLDLGQSGLIVDLKEDTAAGGLRDWCETYATHHSTPYQELRLSQPNSPTWFNSLAGMGPDEQRDAILALNSFEAAYYEALNKELLGQIITLMTCAHEIDPVQFPTPTMYDIAKICGQPDLKSATKRMLAVVLSSMPHLTQNDFLALVSPSRAQQESATGFGSRLGQIYDSQAGRNVLRPGPGQVEIDVTRDGLTYIGLDTLGKQDLSRVISSSILQRMSVYAAQRTTGLVDKGRPRFLIVDEANWVNRTILQNLLSRARSAGISTWVCTQGPNDWVDKDGDDWSKLTQNINVAIIMHQESSEAAEMCAEYLGKTFQEKISEKVSQSRGVLVGPRRARDASGRLMESFTVDHDWDFAVAPDELRLLGQGECYVKVGSPQRRLQFTQVQMRDPKTSPNRH